MDAVSDLYPEYYILKVNDFNRWSKVPLEQWIYFLNTGEIPQDASAPGLDEARATLSLMNMSKEERHQYDRHVDDAVILRDNIYTARGEGRLEGRAEGLVEGRAEGRKEALLETARNFKKLGVDNATIATATGLSESEMADI